MSCIVKRMSPHLITTRFPAQSTAADVIDGVDLGGLRAIVTGASKRAGRFDPDPGRRAGAEVTLAVRNTAAGDLTAQAIRASTASSVRVRWLDLADQRSLAAFIAEGDGALHLLVNNAGLVTGGLERNANGWELQFATNHLGHFALANGLHRALALGASQRGGARIVSGAPPPT
jgi:NAD(P)-dependent dehydrogenase (short-subunit alcohol dehydrogenase family)